MLKKTATIVLLKRKRQTAFVTDGSPRQVYVNVGETGETSFDAGTMINHEKESTYFTYPTA